MLCSVDEARIWAAWEEHTGVPGAELRQELFDRGLWIGMATGLKVPPQVAFFLAARFDIVLDVDGWRRIWNSGLTPAPAMIELADRTARTVRTGLISNTDTSHFEFIEPSLNCLAAFRAVVLSYKVRSVKPDQRIYTAALEAMDTPAAQTLLIDDKEENVIGARRAGMQALRFTTQDALVRELKSLGLEV